MAWHARGERGEGGDTSSCCCVNCTTPPLHYPPPSLPLPYPLPPTFRMGLEWVGISGQPGWGGMGVEWEGQASGELGGVLSGKDKRPDGWGWGYLALRGDMWGLGWGGDGLGRAGALKG